MASPRWTAPVVRGVVWLLLLEALLRLALISPSMRARLAPSCTGRSGAVQWAYERAFRTLTGLDPERGIAFDAELGWVAAGTDVDEHGLRGVPLTPGPRACDVVLLGDSFAWGFGVSAAETFATRLEQARDDVDVWNLGVTGYGLDQMLLRFEREGGRAKPDVVVLLALDLDLPRILDGFYFYPKPQFVLDPTLRLLPRALPAPEDLRRQELIRPAVVQIAQLYAERFAQQEVRPHSPAHLALTHALLDRWLAGVQALGARPLLLLVPTPAELRLARAGGRPVRSAAQVYQPWCAAHPGVCVEGWERFDALAPPPDQLEDASSGHWSAASHAVVARILEEGLGECGG